MFKNINVFSSNDGIIKIWRGSFSEIHINSWIKGCQVGIKKSGGENEFFDEGKEKHVLRKFPINRTQRFVLSDMRVIPKNYQSVKRDWFLSTTIFYVAFLLFVYLSLNLFSRVISAWEGGSVTLQTQTFLWYFLSSTIVVYL